MSTKKCDLITDINMVHVTHDNSSACRRLMIANLLKFYLNFQFTKLLDSCILHAINGALWIVNIT